jgi:LacI family transcriptional regulator
MVHQRTRRATRKDVAQLAGVSPALVSYVMNNGPRPVAAGTRSRILEAIHELNYFPNVSARALRLQRTEVVGLIVPDIANPFFAEFAKALQDECFIRGYALIVADSSYESQGGKGVQIQALLDRQVEGIIDYDVLAAEGFSLLNSGHVPVVSMAYGVDGPRVTTVGIDDYLASIEAVRHLASHGHKRIGYVSGPKSVPISRVRYRGWRDALAQLSLPNDKSLVVNTAITRAGGAAGVQDILMGPDAPTALFVASDLQSMGALYGCHAMGLEVPKDVALISFDGTQETEFSVPPMSVVQQPIKDLAKMAFKQLLDGADEQPPTRTIIPHSLVLRTSCGCRGVLPADSQQSTFLE